MQIDSGGAHNYSQSFDGGRARGLSTSVQMRRTQQAQLQVVTAEGDIVSLTAGSQQDLSLDRLEARVRTAAGRAVRQTESVAFSDTSSIALEVQGDLNEEELADIRQLLEDMDQMGASLLSGQLEPGALQLGGSLASAEGRLSVSEELSATRVRTGRRLRPGRAQRRAARQAGDIVRQRPDRAGPLSQALPRVTNRIFDRLAERFGAAPAEAARSAFQSALSEELARAADALALAFSAESTEANEAPLGASDGPAEQVTTTGVPAAQAPAEQPTVASADKPSLGARPRPTSEPPLGVTRGPAEQPTTNDDAANETPPRARAADGSGTGADVPIVASVPAEATTDPVQPPTSGDFGAVVDNPTITRLPIETAGGPAVPLDRIIEPATESVTPRADAPVGPPTEPVGPPDIAPQPTDAPPQVADERVFGGQQVTYETRYSFESRFSFEQTVRSTEVRPAEDRGARGRRRFNPYFNPGPDTVALNKG